MDHHSFSTVKKGAQLTRMTTVELNGTTYKCRHTGAVFSFDEKERTFTNEIHFWSPLAAEVRKATGWFE